MQTLHNPSKHPDVQAFGSIGQCRDPGHQPEIAEKVLPFSKACPAVCGVCLPVLPAGSVLAAIATPYLHNPIIADEATVWLAIHQFHCLLYLQAVHLQSTPPPICSPGGQ